MQCIFAIISIFLLIQYQALYSVIIVKKDRCRKNYYQLVTTGIDHTIRAEVLI